MELPIVNQFIEFNKIPRLSKEIVITEKIDGTNAQIYINENNEIFAGSRTKWLSYNEDNHGFFKWVLLNKEELLKLGVGRHYGEWWGQGIQRKYGLKEKRFSLFNTSRWNNTNIPTCCHIVPILYTGLFDTNKINDTLKDLQYTGSKASPNFMNPEGIVIYHIAGNLYFKKTIEKDEEYKGKNLK
jgi:hypothetical protein